VVLRYSSSRAREIIRKLERQGSSSVGNAVAMLGMCMQTGGVTVPEHPGDVPVPVIRSIIGQAGLSEEEWERL
jgi:hypothetical protein